MSVELSDQDVYAILTGADMSQPEPVSPDVSSSDSSESVEGTPQEETVEQPILEESTPEEIVEEQSESVEEAEQVEQVVEDATIVGRTIQDITIDSVDEAEQLIEHGINARKAYQTLAPYKQVISVLNENNFTDANKLLMAIDIQNGDMDAIKKLITDLNINPEDLYTEENEKVNYTPKAKVLDDRAMYLQDLVKTHSHANGAVDYIKTTWDNESLEEVGQSPGLLKDIADLMKSGMHEEVVKVMQKDEYLGGLFNQDKIAVERYKDALLAVEAQQTKSKKEKAEKATVQKRSRSGSPKAAPPVQRGGHMKPSVKEISSMGYMGSDNIASLIDSLYINKK